MTPLIRCDVPTYEARVRLLHAAQEIKSMVETAGYEPDKAVWRRGHAWLELSGPTFSLSGSKHCVNRRRITFQITTDDALRRTASPWEDAMSIAGILCTALSTLRGQAAEVSTDGSYVPVRRARTAMVAAAALKDMRAYDLTIQAAGSGRAPSASAYENGPEPWTLRPDVEASLFDDAPDMLAMEHLAGSDTTLVGHWTLEERPEEDPMEVLRSIAASGLTHGDLELRTGWPEPSEGGKRI